ncbi:hypoxanthine phosphoribosyltransferase [bacterium]|nr:hypoxanthine phosphoribosyltransferase [bacterium]
MNSNIKLKPLITEKEIKQRVAALAEEIGTQFSGNTLMIVGLLNGSFIFLADLVRQLNSYHLHLIVDFMRITSYGSNTVTSGKPTLCQDVSINVKERHVLIVDDILDTGYTLEFVVNYLKALDPFSLSVCVLLDKSERRQIDIRADYVGFTVPDAFIVGYGLDCDGRFREMPDIAVLS